MSAVLTTPVAPPAAPHPHPQQAPQRIHLLQGTAVEVGIAVMISRPASSAHFWTSA